MLIRVVTFWNNILAESSKSPAKQLFGVEMRSEADYEYLLDLNQVNSLVTVQRLAGHEKTDGVD